MEKKRKERLQIAEEKKEQILEKVKKRKLEEEIEEKLQELPKCEREKIEIQERKQRRLDLIDKKKSLWKLRNKEKIQLKKTNKTIRLESINKIEDKLKLIEEILVEIREEKKRIAEKEI